MLLVAVAAVGIVMSRDGDDESAGTATRPAADPTATAPATPTTVAAPTPATNGAAPPTTAKPGGPCQPADLSAAVVTSTVRPAGSVRVVALTNGGRRSCTLEGYPGLQLVGLEGEPLTAQVAQGGGAVPPDLGVQVVTVEPGAPASFVMSWDRSGSCLSVRSIGIVLPAETKSVPLDSLQSICGNGNVYLSPFQPGTVSA